VIVNMVGDFFRDYWEQAVTLVTLSIVLATYWRARSVWKSRDFMTRVNFSLNYVEGGRLKIRTLAEMDINQILLGNDHGKRVVLHSASRTTVEKPILRLPEKDAWLVLNSILNELSERFAEGYVAESMGIPTRSARYLFTVTCEKHPDVRMNKIRVMIVEKSLLMKIDELEGLDVERKSHHVRYETLKTMQKLYLDEAYQHAFMEIELATVADPA
jgi:trehalose/maltose hydrolase-like predicted phosphorylase